MLAVLIVTYIVLVDLAKIPFYRAQRAQAATASSPPATDAQRSARRVRRRAAPFVTLSLAGPGQGLFRRRVTQDNLGLPLSRR